jgi:hypothetical protein
MVKEVKEMIVVIRKCIACGKEFATVLDKECDACQRKRKHIWRCKNRKQTEPS